MRYEVKAKGQGRTYTVLKTNEIENASCFAEGFYMNNSYDSVFVTRRGAPATAGNVLTSGGRELIWGKKL